ncbi:hypothetical protein AAK894_00785 [Lachnospiraceae bacterium 46-61]
MIEECVANLTKLMKQKYQKMLKIDNATNDIENALKRNDKVSTEMFMNMRMEIMEEIDSIDNEIQKILTSGDEELYYYLKGLLKIDTQEQAMDTEYEDEKILMLVSLRIHNVLKGIIEKDKEMNKRILGKDSYYSQNKTKTNMY